LTINYLLGMEEPMHAPTLHEDTAPLVVTLERLRSYQPNLPMHIQIRRHSLTPNEYKVKSSYHQNTNSYPFLRSMTSSPKDEELLVGGWKFQTPVSFVRDSVRILQDKQIDFKRQNRRLSGSSGRRPLRSPQLLGSYSLKVTESFTRPIVSVPFISRAVNNVTSSTPPWLHLRPSRANR